MKDLKYLIAFLLPLSALSGLLWTGPWAWATVILAFGILPLLELWTPRSDVNTTPYLEESRSKELLFDALLYLNAPILFGICWYYLRVLTTQTLSTSEITGLTFSAGIVIGTCGINVAHELGHRVSRAEQFLSKLMLLPALYQHFNIEHNRGHHKNVATDKDPATARLGETVYAFWIRSITGSWRSAWAIERERLLRDHKSAWGWENEMIRFSVFQIFYLLSAYAVFGQPGLWGAIAIAVIGILLLETVNYLEHYGLGRRLLDSGRPEPVSPVHSWNSNHELGRIFLYELTRHSDHHFKATRKYQILRHLDKSPQLSYGYPTSLLLALAPPLWFRVMNPIVEKTRKKRS